MYEPLLVLVALAAAFFCAWSSWQLQQSEARIKVQEAEIREKAILVGELADEISMASSYLYEAMDRHLVEIEKQRQELLEIKASAVATPGEVVNTAPTPAEIPMVDEPAVDESYGWFFAEDEAVSSPDPVAESAVTYDPHFQALALAAQGMDLVEIARHTNLGVEELRLFLRFQQELTVAG